MINNQIIQRLELNKEEKVGRLTGIILAGAHFPNTARQVCHNFSHPKQNGLKHFSSLLGQQIDGSLFNQYFHEEKRKHSSSDIVSINVSCCAFEPENNISVKKTPDKV